MDNIEHEKVGRYWFGSGFRWDAASADEKAVVEAQMRSHASDTAATSSRDSARALAQTIADSVRGFVRRSLATRDARIADLERKVAALEGEKAAKPHIRLRSVAGDK